MNTGIVAAFDIETSRAPLDDGQQFGISHEKMNYTKVFRPPHAWDSGLVWAKPADLYVQSGAIAGFFVASESTLLFLPEREAYLDEVTSEMPFEYIAGISREKPRLKAVDYVAGGVLGLASGAFSVLTVPGYFIAKKLENVIEIRLLDGEVTQYSPGGGFWDEPDRPRDVVAELRECKQRAAAVRHEALRAESARKLQERLAARTNAGQPPVV